MTAPVLSGSLSPGGAITLLQTIETRRTTGVLRFKNARVEGDVTLVAGQIAVDQVETSRGQDPVETFLALREGTYEVFQRLPSLPVSKGDDQHRAGSLSVHVPADIMNYCERTGLTGLLLLRQEGREAQVLYDAGQLRAIAVDGVEDSEVRDVFGWHEGTFEVIAYAIPPPPTIRELFAAPDANVMPGREPTFPRIRLRNTDHGADGYRVEEMPQAQILAERDKRRSRDKLPSEEPPSTRLSLRPPAPVESGRPSTVQIVYLGASKEAAQARSDTRHVQDHATRDSLLPEAQPSRRSGDEPRPTKGPRWGWILLGLAVVVAVSALLAHTK